MFRAISNEASGDASWGNKPLIIQLMASIARIKILQSENLLKLYRSDLRGIKKVMNILSADKEFVLTLFNAQEGQKRVDLNKITSATLLGKSPCIYFRDVAQASLAKDILAQVY